MHARIVELAGSTRALYITHLIARLAADAARGARWARLADGIIAKDIGLSHDQVQRARRWWGDVVRYRTRGIPPTVEYDIAATLTAWEAWLKANHIITPNYAPARNQLRAGASSSTRQCVKLYAPARPLDLDDDDDDARTHRKNAITQEIAKAESAARALGLDPAQIKEECDGYQPKYPDRYYLKVLRQRIQAAQAPLPASPSPPAPQRAQPPRPSSRTRSRARTRPGPPQVIYTDKAREEARARARERIAARRAQEHGCPSQR